MENVTLGQVYKELEFIKHKVAAIERDVRVFKDFEPEVREDYLKKLDSIEQEEGVVFENKDEFMNFLRNMS